MTVIAVVSKMELVVIDELGQEDVNEGFYVLFALSGGSKQAEESFHQEVRARIEGLDGQLLVFIIAQEPKLFGKIDVNNQRLRKNNLLLLHIWVRYCPDVFLHHSAPTMEQRPTCPLDAFTFKTGK